MTIDITGLCRDHSFEPAEDLCRSCGGEFCVSCLVHPFGKPLCKTCAIAAAGVRSSGTHKPLNKRDIRKRKKAFDAAMANKRETGEPGPIVADPVVNFEPIESPAGNGVEKLGDTDPAVAIDPDLVAEAAARLAGTAPDPSEASPGETPSNDVAPSVDWSKPFG